MYWTIKQDVQWKGATHPVAVPFLKKNTIVPPTDSRSLFTPRAIPHTRLEIGPGCSSRSYYANLLRNIPGSFRYATPGSTTGALDALISPPDQCSKKTALDKVRRISNGRKSWNAATGTSATFHTTREYLQNRIKLFDQHNFHYVQSGDTTALPGSTQTDSNIYRPNGISSCSKYFISASAQNNVFSYTWTNGQTFTVEFPDGWYNLATFQNALEQIQRANGTYFLNELTGAVYYLFRFTHNDEIDRISLSILNPSIYTGIATNQLEEVDEISDVSVSLVNSTLGEVGLGFQSRVYHEYGVHDSDRVGKLATTYHRTYYRPSNPQYSTSHAVPSSDRILRLQYNTINRTAATYLEPFGHGNAVAMAYGVMRNSRVEKDKYTPPYCLSKRVLGEPLCIPESTEE